MLPQDTVLACTIAARIAEVREHSKDLAQSHLSGHAARTFCFFFWCLTFGMSEKKHFEGTKDNVSGMTVQSCL